MRQRVRSSHDSMHGGPRDRGDVLPMELYRNARSEAIARHSQRQQQQGQRQQREEQEIDIEDNMDAVPRQGKEPSLMDRIRMEKNRVVQRCLVACRLAEPSKDMFFKQKKSDFAAEIERLQVSKQTIQQFSSHVQSKSANCNVCGLLSLTGILNAIAYTFADI